MSKFKAIFSIFSPPKIAAPVAPPPPVSRDIADPAIEEAKKKLKKSESQRVGRAASILTGGQGVDDLGGTGVTQTTARGAQLLGGSA